MGFGFCFQFFLLRVGRFMFGFIVKLITIHTGKYRKYVIE